jgi:hypothetical protein
MKEKVGQNLITKLIDKSLNNNKNFLKVKLVYDIIIFFVNQMCIKWIIIITIFVIKYWFIGFMSLRFKAIAFNLQVICDSKVTNIVWIRFVSSTLTSK